MTADAIVAMCGRLVAMNIVLEMTDGMSPAEHAEFWRRMWAAHELRKSDPELVDAVVKELTNPLSRFDDGDCGVLHHLIADEVDRDFHERTRWSHG